MKKIVSSLLACILLIGCIFTLASCSKSLVGTYEADLGVSEITYKFGAFGKVTRTVDPLVGDNTVTEGTYKFNDAGDEITLTFGEESKTYDFSSGTEDGDDYIKLDLIKYEKED